MSCATLTKNCIDTVSISSKENTNVAVKSSPCSGPRNFKQSPWPLLGLGGQVLDSSTENNSPSNRICQIVLFEIVHSDTQVATAPATRCSVPKKCSVGPIFLPTSLLYYSIYCFNNLQVQIQQNTIKVTIISSTKKPNYCQRQG